MLHMIYQYLWVTTNVSSSEDSNPTLTKLCIALDETFVRQLSARTTDGQNQGARVQAAFTIST